MIDFNTMLNQAFSAAIEQAQKPLLEKIETLEKRVTDMDAFFAMWNFNDPDAFALKVSNVVIDPDNDMVRGYIDNAIGAYDFDSTIENYVDSWWRSMDISDDVEKAVNNMGIVTEDSLDDAMEAFINDKVSVSIEVR